MRYSNNFCTKGSIVFIHDKKDSFLNKRPLLVISNPNPILHSVMVCPIGTRGKPGIKCSLYNPHTDDYVSGVEESTIYPNSIYTIKESDIRRTLGVIDPYIMREVDKAIDFFRGLTDEIPPFLRPVEKQYCGVEYTYAYEVSESGDSHLDEVSEESIDSDTLEDTQDDNIDEVDEIEKEADGIAYNVWLNKKPMQVVDLIGDEYSSKIIARSIPISQLNATFAHKSANFFTDIRNELTSVSVNLAMNYLNTNNSLKQCADFIKIGFAIIEKFYPEQIPDGKESMCHVLSEIAIDKYSIDFSNKRIWRTAPKVSF